MFWAKARRVYRGVTKDDPDVRKFLLLANQFQKDVYGGLGGYLQDLGHKWVSAKTTSLEGNVLEIGFGAGRHSLFFSGDRTRYFASEYTNAHLSSEIWTTMAGRLLRCDARELPFADSSFHAVISIYNLEHISELESVFHEVHRVLEKGGRFLLALPCEGGLAWNLGRELTTRRYFQKKYKINYDKVIAFEHVWSFYDIENRLRGSGLFRILARRFYPFLVPSVNMNIVGCIECQRASVGGD